MAGVEILGAAGVYERRDSPTTPRLVLLAVVVGTAPALNNLSLSLNNLGFYQVVKLLVTPLIVLIECQLYGTRMSMARAIALLFVCFGVGIAVVNDIALNSSGMLAALCWLPVAAVYKTLWSRIAKEEKWHTFALMRRVLPMSTVVLVMLVPVIDPPGVLDFHWTPRRTALILLSGVCAFFVNWSGFLVMGACSALSHTVLGQLKACIIILGGWIFFAQSYPLRAIGGAAVAVCAMIAYTRFNLAEQQAAKAQSLPAVIERRTERQSEETSEVVTDGEAEPRTPLMPQSSSGSRKRAVRGLQQRRTTCAFGAPNFAPSESIDERLRASDVEVVLELVDSDRAPDTNGMAITKKVVVHASRKEAANRLYQKNALWEAVAKWELAEKTLPMGNNLRYDLQRGRWGDEFKEAIDAERAEVEKVQLSTQLNLASVLMRLGEPVRALDHAEKALKIAPTSVKGLYRRGQAKLQIPPVDVDDVKADLMAAARMEPQNREIRSELEKLKAVHAQHVKAERDKYGGLFERQREKEKKGHHLDQAGAAEEAAAAQAAGLRRERVRAHREDA